MIDVSVVIPLYNKQDSLSRCITSVLRQSYPHFNLIIVDDGSTDQSYDVASKFQDSRITILRQKNAGVSAARNVGVAAAGSSHVCFLDADDEWHEDFVDTIVRLIRANPEASIYSTRHVVIDEGGRETLGSLSLPSDFFGRVDDFYDVYRRSQTLINSSSVCVNKAMLLSIGGFPAGKKVGEDVFVWLKLAQASEAMFSANIQSVAHHDAENRTNTRVSGVVPFYIEYYLDDSVGIECMMASKSLRRFIAHYSRIYALEAVRNKEFSLARYYCGAWRKISIINAASIAVILLLPPAVAQMARDLRRAVGRTRGRFFSANKGPK